MVSIPPRTELGGGGGEGVGAGWTGSSAAPWLQLTLLRCKHPVDAQRLETGRARSRGLIAIVTPRSGYGAAEGAALVPPGGGGPVGAAEPLWREITILYLRLGLA